MAWDREKERKAGKNLTVASHIFGILFMIFWCIMAISMGAWFMGLFGLPMLGLMIYRLVVMLRLSGEEEKKEPPKSADPWDRPQEKPKRQTEGGRFCPYCGSSLQEDFAFCPKCGRRQ